MVKQSFPVSLPNPHLPSGEFRFVLNPTQPFPVLDKGETESCCGSPKAKTVRNKLENRGSLFFLCPMSLPKIAYTYHGFEGMHQIRFKFGHWNCLWRVNARLRLAAKEMMVDGTLVPRP
jgi:hypothetical protein